jgi:DNA-binding HxlR family transcriptional regulator
MNDRLLETSKKILSLLFDKNLHVNEIIRQTSPDRSYIISTIKMLEREGLIVRNKRTEKGKEIVKQLTELGRELVDISRSVEQWEKSCFQLRKAYEEKLLIDVDSDDGKVIKRLLKNRGLTDEEINRRDYIEDGLSQLLSNCETDMIDTVICRCFFTIFKFSFGRYVVAIDIMNDIIKHAAVFRFNVMMEEVKQERQEAIKSIIHAASNMTTGLMWKIQHDLLCPGYQIIHNEIKDVMISRLNLLKPPEDIIPNDMPKDMQEMIIPKNMQGIRPLPAELDVTKIQPNDFKQALDICREYLNRLST